MSLRFLVVEGNTRATREAHLAGFGASPADHYGAVLLEVAGGGSYDILCPADPDASLPHNSALKDYDGVVLTGSALHLWHGEPESMRQVELARAIFKANVPFFGSCWGLQVAAVAAGGAVHQNPRGREMGFARRIVPNSAGRTHPLLKGRPEAYEAPCSHLDEVKTLPPDATLLASNAISMVQAAEIRHEGGTFWGVQYHPEFTPNLTAYLIERRGETLIEEGLFTDKAQHEAYVADIRALEDNPKARHVAFRHGLGPDVTEPDLRVLELRNFIEARVKPHHAAR